MSELNQLGTRMAKRDLDRLAAVLDETEGRRAEVGASWRNDNVILVC